jgi:hypothetical protein
MDLKHLRAVHGMQHWTRALKKLAPHLFSLDILAMINLKVFYLG